jgi:S1-C subfamily serine protease
MITPMSTPFSRRHFALAVLAVVGATALLVATLSRGANATPRDAAEVVTPALVNINTNLAYQGAQAAGTGIVLTSDGTVVTNNHVIRGATTIRATDVGNGRTYSATVVGYDVAADLAVLKLKNASGLKTAKIGDSSKVRVGDAVVAVGNAGGAGGIPSSARGSIVRLGSSITASDGGSDSERLTGMLETDAQLQPGDSGGALADANGRVIGINTAAGGSTFQPSYGLWGDDSGSGFSGFAIPINRALDKVKQIQKGQASATTHIGPTALLGVSVGSTGYGYGDYFGNGYTDTATGALVQNVLSGSGAERAGLQPGDVITVVDGRRITASTTLTNVLLRRSPSQSVTVVWTDQNGSSHRASVRLMVGPPQ